MAEPPNPGVRVPTWLISGVVAVGVAAAAFAANTILRVEALHVKVEQLERVGTAWASKEDVQRLERQLAATATKDDVVRLERQIDKTLDAAIKKARTP